MSRKRNRQKPLWVSFPLWAAVAILVFWGLWQLAEFRKKVLASTADSGEAQIGDASPPASSQPTAQNATDPVIDNVPQQEASTAPATDPWLEATAPATQNAIAPQDAPATTRQYGPTIVVDIAPLNNSPEDFSHEVTDLLTDGQRLLDSGAINRLVEARTALNTALSLIPDGPRAQQLRDELASLNGPVFLGSAIFPEDPAASYVEVQSGDSFLRIGHRFSIPATLLVAINPGLNPRNLKPGTGIKIIQGPFNVRLAKHAGRLDLFARDIYVHSFPATLEEGNFLTDGTYRIKPAAKIEVGKRQWIGFEGAEDSTQEITAGWLYASAGPRVAGPNDHPTGLKLADADLAVLFYVLSDGHSLLHVDP